MAWGRAQRCATPAFRRVLGRLRLHRWAFTAHGDPAPVMAAWADDGAAAAHTPPGLAVAFASTVSSSSPSTPPLPTLLLLALLLFPLALLALSLLALALLLHALIPTPLLPSLFSLRQIKLGQVFSSRKDLLHPAYCDAPESLQTSVTGVSGPRVRELLDAVSPRSVG